MTTTATETTGREGAAQTSRCGECGHGADVHGVVAGCMGLAAANACCSCRLTSSDFFGRVGIMPEPVAQDLLRQVEAIDRVHPTVRALSDRCRHGIDLAVDCGACVQDISAAEGSRPHVADAGARRAKAVAELNAEVERARKTASAAAQKIGERHSAEWTTLVSRCLVGVHDAKTTARLMHAFAEAISLSARQGCELVLSAHDVLDGELAKLVASPGAAARPSTATAGEVTMDALMSGDPLIVCRALWGGEVAADATILVNRLGEWVHGQVADADLEDRHRELLVELLLVLGGPRSATA